LRTRWAKNTLIAALGCLSHLSELLAFEYYGDNKLLRNLSNRYAEGHEHEVNQATGYSVKWLQWAESMVLGQFPASKPDRLVCGRMRIMAQSSTRHHDLKNGPLRLVNWVLNKDSSKRAAVGQCTETKTFAKTWVCSRLAVAESNDGWLEATISLAWRPTPSLEVMTITLVNAPRWIGSTGCGPSERPSRHQPCQVPYAEG
jgi:hypothetical protein